MECGGNFGGSSRSERITTTRHECDGWCRLVSVCLFARAFKIVFGGVMEWGAIFGGSSQSGRIATTRHIRDGW